MTAPTRLTMIDAYDFGRIVIDGREYTGDVIIYPGRVDDSWWRAEGHRVSMADLQGVLRENPEVLIIGTGASGLVEIGDDVREHVESAKIRLIAARTAEACTHYNDLVREHRVIAALHLTC